ncbi:MAG TPA: inositol monophosphatase [Firmicutes bacterium]|jgi:myo-inositol-1(or 4)-monophosphatase|nr:inositol monophosphatase [Bacillota bacterium]
MSLISSDILTICTKAAQQAGALLKANFRHGELSIEKKADQSLVTNLDKEAEQIIRSQIKAKFPSHGIIGEESGREGAGNDYIWIIDPLDGTHNFIRGINMFGVSIGVVHQDCFVAGVIYLPVWEELYIAEHGGGAYKNDQKIQVSGYQNLAESTIAFDAGIKKDPRMETRVLGVLAAHTFNIRMFGASVRQLSYLAEGVVDGIVEFDDHPWDYAAGACILTEAGGRITNLEGGPLTPQDNGFLASNGKVHQQIQEIVHNSR